MSACRYENYAKKWDFYSREPYLGIGVPKLFPTQVSESRSAGNAYWGANFNSKFSGNSRSGHEILSEDDVKQSQRSSSKINGKSEKIIAITESSVSYEMDKMDLVAHGALVLDEPEEASVGSTENLHKRKK